MYESAAFSSTVVPSGIAAQKNYCTCSLEVESHHVTASGPQWIRVIVGGFYTLAFWIDTTQSLAIVLQEVFGAALAWCLVLNEGADFFIAVTICRDRVNWEVQGQLIMVLF